MKITKETLRRAWRTFFQAAISYVAVNIVAINFTDEAATVKSAVVGVAVSALSAGISALMNLESEE